MENNPSSTHDQYVQTIKSAFISLGKKVVLKKLLAQLPFLAWGPLAPLVGLAVEKILTIVVNEGETGIFFLYTDIRVHAQGRAFSAAAIHNFKIQQNGTKDEKDAAEKSLIDAFNKLVKFTN